MLRRQGGRDYLSLQESRSAANALAVPSAHVKGGRERNLAPSRRCLSMESIVCVRR